MQKGHSKTLVCNNWAPKHRCHSKLVSTCPCFGQQTAANNKYILLWGGGVKTILHMESLMWIKPLHIFRTFNSFVVLESWSSKYIYIFSKLGRHRWSKDSVGARILGIAINKSKVKLNTWILDLVYDRDDSNVFGNPTRSAAKVAGEILRNWLKIIMGKRVGIKRWSYYKSWLNWVVCVLFYLVWF